MSLDARGRITPPDPAGVLRQHGLHASRKLGQNFLRDPDFLEQVATAAQIAPADTVLEIGAGLGGLTVYLARAARAVIAVEVDSRLLAPLRDALAKFENIRLIHGDILELDPAAIIGQPDYLVVANIPYYITSAVVRHLLESARKPRRIILTVQAEVAERICAAPGRLSLLALSVQVFGRPEVVARVPAAAFYPVPKVDSAILRVVIHPQPLIPEHLLRTFFQLIKAGFGQKRKTLRNSLSAGLKGAPADVEAWLLGAGIDPRRRAETLGMDEWRVLCESSTGGIGLGAGR